MIRLGSPFLSRVDEACKGMPLFCRRMRGMQAPYSLRCGIKDQYQTGTSLRPFFIGEPHNGQGLCAAAMSLLCMMRVQATQEPAVHIQTGTLCVRPAAVAEGEPPDDALPVFELP